MHCLHCGDCCLRMSPLSAPEPCPHIWHVEDFYFCDRYQRRPDECSAHTFHSRFCPIGQDKLGISDPDIIRQRLDAGYALIKYRGEDLNTAMNSLYMNKEQVWQEDRTA